MSSSMNSDELKALLMNSMGDNTGNTLKDKIASLGINPNDVQRFVGDMISTPPPSEGKQIMASGPTNAGVDIQAFKDQLAGSTLANSTKKKNKKYVSETFEKLVTQSEEDDSAFAEMVAGARSKVKTAEEARAERERKELLIAKTPEILKKFEVNLNSIDIYEPEVSNAKIAEMIKSSVNEYFENRRTFPAVCFQSNYKADMCSLTHEDIQTMNSSPEDSYSFQLRYYSVLHDCLKTTSLGFKPPFDEWLKMTSFFDLESIIFGVYNATYPDSNKFKVKCKYDKCMKMFDAVVNNDTLIKVDDDMQEMMEKSQEIRFARKPIEELISESHLATRKRILLEECKIIFQLKVPSLYYHLKEVLRYTAEKTNMEGTVLAALFTDKIYLPNIEQSMEAGKAIYYPPVTDIFTKLKIINSIPPYDAEDLAFQMGEFINKYRIRYRIKDVVCPHCKKKMDDIPIKLEHLLFLAISQGRSGRFTKTNTGTESSES